MQASTALWFTFHSMPAKPATSPSISIASNCIKRSLTLSIATTFSLSSPKPLTPSASSPAMPAGRKAMGSLTIVTLAALTSTSSARLSVTHRSHHHRLQIIFPSVHSQTEVFSCDVCKSLGQGNSTNSSIHVEGEGGGRGVLAEVVVGYGVNTIEPRCVNEVVFRLNGAGFSDSVGREQGEQGAVRGGDAAAAMSVRRCCFCTTATRSRMPAANLLSRQREMADVGWVSGVAVFSHPLLATMAARFGMAGGVVGVAQRRDGGGEAGFFGDVSARSSPSVGDGG
nr:uncharacterized protein LOC109186382 [Ipomoea batatas]